MTTQIAVRLPDDMVEFLDQAIADGRATSRASIITSALEREIRRIRALEDVEILKRLGAQDDLDELVDWSTSHVEIEVD